jgi:pseudouridine synthase
MPRLQKLIADSGYCSRRFAEELISAGRVFVNGTVAHIGQNAETTDEITINGRTLHSQPKKVYIMLNKPIGYTCTSRSFKNEKNVFDLVNVPERLFTVGRLDKDSRGLVLLTNDGDLTEKLTHPRYEHEKVYRVTVANYSDSQLIIKKFLAGIPSDGEILKAKSAKLIRPNYFEITLTEGKNRQIRRMFGAMECNVLDLERIAIGNIKLEDLQEGRWKEINNPSNYNSKLMK